MAPQTRADDDGTVSTNYPAADDVRPVSTNDAQSIQASGSYRSILNDALTSMGDSDLADADPDAARRVRDSASTVLKVRSIAEAEAVAVAATYALNGGDHDGLTSPQRDALVRVKEEAERLAVAFTPEAHGMTTSHADDDDEDDDEERRIMTDGGRVETYKTPAATLEGIAQAAVDLDLVARTEDVDVEHREGDQYVVYLDVGTASVGRLSRFEDAIGARNIVLNGWNDEFGVIQMGAHGVDL